MSTTVGVFGATGYAGRELIRLLASHPDADVVFTTGSGGGHLAHEKGLEQAADVYFLALPHGVAAKYAKDASRELSGLSHRRSLGRPSAPDARGLQASGTATTTRLRSSSVAFPTVSPKSTVRR